MYVAGLTSSSDFPGATSTTPGIYNGFMAALDAPGVGVAGDFDGNGVPDILWQSDATRQVTLYYYIQSVGSPATSGSNWIWADSAPGWCVVATGDFNGDGHPDLVWQADSTREVTVQYYGGSQGNVMLGYSWLWTSPAPG